MEPATRLPTSSPAVTYRYKEIENVVEGGVHLDLYLPKEEQCVRGSPCPVGSSLPLPLPFFSIEPEEASKAYPYLLTSSFGSAVFYHGGSWVMGSATDVQPRQIDWFLARGIAVASVEYRLAPQSVAISLPSSRAAYNAEAAQTHALFLVPGHSFQGSRRGRSRRLLGRLPIRSREAAFSRSGVMASRN